MRKMHRVHSHPIGVHVQRPKGRVEVKVGDIDGAKWIGRGRLNYMRHHKVELEKNQRIYHMDGDVANDDPSNLVCIRFSGVRRYDLVRSKVIYTPTETMRPRQYWQPPKRIEAKVV